MDPIIAVENVQSSAQWYQQIFGWQSHHGGDIFDVLRDEDGEVRLCLHSWGEHEHPTMIHPQAPGNGLILYVRTPHMEHIRKRVEQAGLVVERDIYVNPNSQQREFSLRDLDGYFLIISEYYEY